MKFWIPIAVVVGFMGWVAYEFVTSLNHEQTDCLIKWCTHS